LIEKKEYKMEKAINLKILILLTVLIFFGFKTADIPVIEPYLLNVTPTSIQIHWEIAKGQSHVRYGEDKSLGNEIIVHGKSRKQQVELAGLRADTYYYYQIESGNRIFGPNKFKTAPLGEKKVTFCVYGDNRIKDTSFQYPHPHGEIIAGIQRDNPDFFINTGDIFKTGVDTLLFMEDFFLGAKDLIAYTPMFLAIGNHEYIGDPQANATKKYFAFPDDQTWYKVEYGKIQFLFLDSTQLLYTWNKKSRIKRSALEIRKTDQYKWLKDNLKKPKPTWRIVVMHHHIFSSGIFGTDNLLVETLVPLFEKYNVDLVLAGHEHNYERSEKDGITYILTGGGGSYLRPVNVKSNSYQKSAAAEFHHVRIQIDGRKLSGTVICDVDRRNIPDYSSDHKLAISEVTVGDVIDTFKLEN
jgi:hypothetical protein